jgi:protoporphyrinogen oxidase
VAPPLWERCGHRSDRGLLALRVGAHLTEFVVIGSGMAACGAIHELGRQGVVSIVFDQAEEPGGHTKTRIYDGGWVFDEGPHISFTTDPRVQELLAANVSGEYVTLRATVNNYWRGHWVKHPAQVNLHGLPDEVVVACVRDFVEALPRDPDQASDYETWLRAAYGDTFAETFPMQYTRKSHTTEAANLTTDWLGPRMYKPALEEVLRGALSPATPDVHYIDHYRYPRHGGFFSYLKPFLAGADLRLGHRVVAIDPADSVVSFADGSGVRYRGLVSSIPLPELVPMVVGVPSDVRQAAGRLAASSVVFVNVGIDRDDVSGHSWTYFYDEDFIITRLSYPHVFSPHNAPPGCGSFQAEIYFSEKYRPLRTAPDSLVDVVVGDLRRCGLIGDDDTILHTSTMLAPYANVIFDHQRAEALETVLGYLDEVGIATAGRYGLWGYQWTDESFISGELAVERILDRAR